jgi:hypothetical protein
MKVWRAIGAGLAGGVLVIVIVRAFAWASGAHADLCLLLGSALTGDTDSTAWIVGGVGQLVIAAVAAIIYAAIFEWVTNRAGAVIGVLIAIPHVVVAGLSIGFLPGARLLDAGITPPGAFMAYRGAVVLVGFVFAHLVFGAVMGLSYGRTRHVIRAAGPVWREVIETPKETS